MYRHDTFCAFVYQFFSWLNADFVMEFDWMAGRIMETLDSLGLSDNTLLIVTSDNGGLPKPKDGRGHDSTYPWRGKKQTAFEGGHRIPVICRGTGISKRNSSKKINNSPGRVIF